MFGFSGFFTDWIVFLCWYKDVKEGAGLKTFSMKGWFCPTKVPGPPAKVTSEKGQGTTLYMGNEEMGTWGGVKNEAATGSSGSVAAIFLSGPTIDFQAHRGIMDGMESFGRISLSQVSNWTESSLTWMVLWWKIIFLKFFATTQWSLASSRFFGSGLQSVFGFGMRYLHYSNLSPVNRFSIDGWIWGRFSMNFGLGF